MISDRILIVHHQTLGLTHDALVLSRALEKALFAPTIRSLVIPGNLVVDYEKPLDIPGALNDLAPFDYMFLLEHAHANPPLMNANFARRVIYIPNIEWLNDLDKAVLGTGAIDMVMLKNRFSFDAFFSAPVAGMVRRIELTGWTSEDVADAHFCLGEKDYGQFLHVRGVSMQKQTEIVMEAWASHPEFPPLTVVLRFFGGFELSQPLRYANNVSIHLRNMPELELRRMQNRIGLHLSPSNREGFGHSLNEARACSSVLVTTDGPPMNELVSHGENGLLVSPSKITRVGYSSHFDITSEGLAEQVDALLSMSAHRRRDMGRLSRKKYLIDRDAFHRNVARCCELLVSKKDF
jgi:glycosyltransferase involved in cell wall biosynthesis